MIPPQQTEMPGGLDGFDGIQSILKGVGRNNLGIELFGGIQIVVVGGYAGCFQLPRLRQSQMPEGNTDLHPQSG